MPEIEFLQTEHSGGVAVAPPPSGRGVRAAVRAVPAVLSLGAAALAVWSPFLPIYRLVEPSSNFTDSGSTHPTVALSFDGWGRVHSSEDIGSVSGAGHGAHYGIVLVVAAALFVVAAIGYLLAATVRGTPVGAARTTAALLSAAGAGLAAAMSAVFWLDYHQVRDQLAGLTSVDGPGAAIQVSQGSAWLVGAGAAGAALLAVVSGLLVARLARERGDVGAAVTSDSGPDSQRQPSFTDYGSQIPYSGEPS